MKYWDVYLNIFLVLVELLLWEVCFGQSTQTQMPNSTYIKSVVQNHLDPENYVLGKLNWNGY